MSAIEPGLVKTGLPGTMWEAAERTLVSAEEEPRRVYEAEFRKVRWAVAHGGVLIVL